MGSGLLFFYLRIIHFACQKSAATNESRHSQVFHLTPLSHENRGHFLLPVITNLSKYTIQHLSTI